MTKKKEKSKEKRPCVTIRPSKNCSYVILGVNGDKARKMLHLSDDETKNYKLIGTDNGQNFFHCLLYSGKACKKFFEKSGWLYHKKIKG